MINWAPFVYKGQTYDLSHLHPFNMMVTQDATNTQPKREYNVQVFFSLHCFTKSEKGQEQIDTDLLYRDNREVRVFDFRRYELSKNLRDIIEDIGRKKCFHTGHDNYFIIELLDQKNNKIEYEIYFTLSRGKKILNLYIQSAYSRDGEHRSGHKKKKPIRFVILAHNIQKGRKIVVPK
ncbi:MAG: hypothetical protein KZQ64_08115 [gamma proteobacterium symbiont of Bathyaustriella thionipta]|nr:hypothetical protein [gamma proteobacterium symbiont of Bathyaustriella thionipta]MCU7950574.1 hypothetical protein [gamma proteobacterium symbiont of Bathyaustriella thionipta]MCU7953337.1 hypothetical protein [gamma proteobacterium symbiont of Bathyaustriella thionipta]MCU7957077.1 hypothetical protein [gamma proteobacterium symbiont of Bathyaustriella thionipta]